MGPGGSLLNSDSKKEGDEECRDHMVQNSVVQLVTGDTWLQQAGNRWIQDF